MLASSCSYAITHIHTYRKVAIPVPDGFVWAEFMQQVKSKLRICGVKEIFLASVSRGHSLATSNKALQEACSVT
jgi:hypothetical protein